MKKMKNFILTVIVIFTATSFSPVSAVIKSEGFYTHKNVKKLEYKIPFHSDRRYERKNNNSRCERGKNDAIKYHGRRDKHTVLASILGPFAVIGTALGNPTPDKGKYTNVDSENRDLFNDPIYKKCYKKQAKSINLKGSLLGLLIWPLVVGLVILIWGIISLTIFLNQ